MKRLLSIISVAGIGFLSLIGVSNTDTVSSVPAGIKTLSETSPLYLNKAVPAQMDSTQGNLLLVQHYSHSSHSSHASHMSHYSSRY